MIPDPNLIEYEDIFKIVRLSLWGIRETIEISEKTFDEMKLHGIIALPASELSKIILPGKLRSQWRNEILDQIAFYSMYQYEQLNLPITVPYVILKGTSAAQYYPHPEYRKMGDIDIMTMREDFESACLSLVKSGYVEIPRRSDSEFIRHREFHKNGILVEVHLYFAELNNTRYAKYLDDTILANISSSHVLPDLVNGLVLLEHINQHLEEGIGLRQILDWMMFVDKSLPDHEWPKFQQMVNSIGLETLAIIVTRMCEMYLGLPCRKWSSCADVNLSNRLLEYVMSCGNFGNKIAVDNIVGTNVLAYSDSPIATIKLLQKRGTVNWKLANKYLILRPFAWVYQTGRYIIRGLARKDAALKIKSEYGLAKKRNQLLKKLGVKRNAKGVTIYKNGKYLKYRN